MHGFQISGISDFPVKLSVLFIIGFHTIHAQDGSLAVLFVPKGQCKGIFPVNLRIFFLILAEYLHDFRCGKGFVTVRPFLAHQLTHDIVSENKSAYRVGIHSIPVG